MDPKKRYRLSVLGVGIGFLALGWMSLSLHSEVENLSRRVSDYQENVTHWNQEFSRSLSNQETTIRDALASEASLFTGVETVLDDQDGGLVLTVSLIPKEFSPGDTALLALDTGESIPPLLSAAGAQAVGDPPAGGDTLFRGTPHPFQ